jgi:predicted  nucleic acid-binding Zn-ribbon protein
MADLRGSIKALSRTSREFSGLQRIREDAVQLNQTLGIQKSELEKVKVELTRQRAAHAALDKAVDRARASVEEATAAHAKSRQELERERAAIEAILGSGPSYYLAKISRVNLGIKGVSTGEA